MTYAYRAGDLARRLAFLAQLIGAAAAGAGVWIAVVVVFSLGAALATLPASVIVSTFPLFVRVKCMDFQQRGIPTMASSICTRRELRTAPTC